MKNKFKFLAIFLGLALFIGILASCSPSTRKTTGSGPGPGPGTTPTNFYLPRISYSATAFQYAQTAPIKILPTITGSDGSPITFTINYSKGSPTLDAVGATFQKTNGSITGKAIAADAVTQVQFTVTASQNGQSVTTKTPITIKVITLTPAQLIQSIQYSVANPYAPSTTFAPIKPVTFGIGEGVTFAEKDPKNSKLPPGLNVDPNDGSIYGTTPSPINKSFTYDNIIITATFDSDPDDTVDSTPFSITVNPLYQDGFMPPLPTTGDNSVSTIAFSPADGTLAIGSGYRGQGNLGVRLYNKNSITGEYCSASENCYSNVLPAMNNYVVSATTFSHYGGFLAIGTNHQNAPGSGVRVYKKVNGNFCTSSTPTGSCYVEVTGPDNYASSFTAFSKHDLYLAVGPDPYPAIGPAPVTSSGARLFNQTGSSVDDSGNFSSGGFIQGANFTPANNQLISGMAFSEDGTYLALGTAAVTGKGVRLYKSKDGVFGIPSPTCDQNGDFTKYACADGFTPPGSNTAVSTVTFNGSSDNLAIGSALAGNGLTVYYNSESTEDFCTYLGCYTELAASDNPALVVSATAFSPDGQILAVASTSTDNKTPGQIRFYKKGKDGKFCTIQQLCYVDRTLPADFTAALTMAFSPDSQYLAVGTNKQTNSGAILYNDWPFKNAQ